MTVAPRLSVCQHTTWHQTFDEDVALYTRLGVAGIELTERKMSRDRHTELAELARIDEAGLAITTVQPRVCALYEDSMYPHLADPYERVAEYRKTIDLLTEALPGREFTFITVTGKAPSSNYAEGHRVARELYAALADYAGERGCRIAFEPLNPVFMNTDTFICTLDDGLRLIEDVGRSNFGLLLDTWHVWAEPSINERVSQLGNVVFGVHVSDWPASGPRSQGDRLVPGDGVIDLPGMFAALDRSGYDGALCLEIFSVDDLPDSLWQIDPTELIERSRAGIERAWEARRADAPR